MENTTRTQRSLIVFVIFFVACYLSMYVAYMMIPDNVLRDTIYPWSIVKPVIAGINLFATDSHVAEVGSTVVSARASLEIVRGCDCAGVVFLLTAAILSFPSSWRSKAIGIGSGLIFILLANHARLVALYFVLAYVEPWFVPLHVYVFPTLIVLLAGVHFIAWAGRHGGLLGPPGRSA